MKNILKIFAVLSILLSPGLLFAGQSSAVNIFNHTCDSSAKLTTSTACKDVEAQKSNGTNPIISIIKGAISLVSYIVGVAAVLGIIISGVRFIVSSGDSNAIASARTGLTYSLIGVGVAVIAQVIVVFVLKDIS